MESTLTDLTSAIFEGNEFEALVNQIQRVALERAKIETNLSYQGRRAIYADVTAAAFREHFAEVVLVKRDRLRLTESQKALLVEDLIDNSMGLGEFNKIMKLAAGRTSNIQVLGTKGLVVEDFNGERVRHESVFRSLASMVEWVRRLARTFGAGEPFDPAQPSVDLYLPGVRFNASYEENYGCVVSLRFTNFELNSLDTLVGLGSLSLDEAMFLRAAVLARLNVVISGATNTGKTTLLRAALRETPPLETIVTIEDSRELELQEFVDPDVVVLQMLERRPNIDGHGAVTSADLFKNSLRQRPDRTVIGECRGQIVVDFLQAMNSGQDGAMTTLHATGPHAVVTRMVRCADGLASLDAIVADIRTGLDLVIQVHRDERSHARYLKGIYQVDPTHEKESRVRFTTIFEGEGTSPSKFLTNPVGRVKQRLRAVDWEPPALRPGLVNVP